MITTTSERGRAFLRAHEGTVLTCYLDSGGVPTICEGFTLRSRAVRAAEIGITAPTLGEVAQVVAAAHNGWTVIGAQIEALRLGAKAAVSAATDAATAEAAALIDWP